MKNLLVLAFSALVLAVSFSACSGCSSQKSEVEEDTIPTFAKGDTTDVLNMTTRYLDLVKNKQYDDAVSMLRVIVNDTANAVSEDMKQSIIRQHKNFPVLAYSLDDMTFIDATHVRITYSIEFFEKEPGSKIPNTVKLAFEPQRINAEWFLGLSEGFAAW